jgi:hypothetical protein
MRLETTSQPFLFSCRRFVYRNVFLCIDMAVCDVSVLERVCDFFLFERASLRVSLLPTFLMAPRSRSSSESSHDSESPRKRTPSDSDAEGEIDAPGSPAINGLCSANEPPRVTPGCVHIEVLLGSTRLVHNYEKAVRWVARSRNDSGPPRKRRKACLNHSFTLNGMRFNICK